MVARAAFRTIVVNRNGNRNVPYANRDGKRWYRNWNWLDNDFNSNGRVALPRKRHRFIFDQNCSAG